MMIDAVLGRPAFGSHWSETTFIELLPGDVVLIKASRDPSLNGGLGWVMYCGTVLGWQTRDSRTFPELIMAPGQFVQTLYGDRVWRLCTTTATTPTEPAPRACGYVHDENNHHIRRPVMGI